MIIQLAESVQSDELTQVQTLLHEQGYSANEVKTQGGHYLVAVGKGEIDIRQVGHFPFVRDVHRVTDSFQLVSRKWKVGRTSVAVGGDAAIGPEELTLIAGPCSIHNEKQVEAVVQHLKECNVRFMRGGVFKPRTSPYSFQGHGLEALKMFSAYAHGAGIKVVSEVLAAEQIEKMYPYVDVFQVGTRNTQNFTLLSQLGRVDKPVLLKRGMSGTVEELLQSAEYVFSGGNEQLILCERGIRTFESAYRNTLDLNAVALLRNKTHLPVVVDPSHGVGVRRLVEPLALAAVMAGADGLLVEVEPIPEEALSDGQQTLDFAESRQLFYRTREAYSLRQDFPVVGIE